MTRRLPLLAVLPLLLALVGCGPTPVPAADDSTPPTVAVTPTVGPTAEPVVITPDDYLLEGGIDEDPDGDGFWSAHYGFWVDESHSVRCDIVIFSGDDPVTFCSVVPGNEAKIEYPLPAGAQCDYTTANPFDGYTMAVGSKGLYPASAGFSGCQDAAGGEDFAAQTKLLPDGAELTVEPFHCSVADKVAECERTDGQGSFAFGLATATSVG